MRSRSVFLEDGRRLFNIGTLAPEAIWPSVEADFDRLLGSFALEDVQGITTAPLRLMTSEPSIDLSAAAPPPASGSDLHATTSNTAPDRGALETVPSETVEPQTTEPNDDLAAGPSAPDAEATPNWLAGADDRAASPNDQPTRPADVALADDASSLDEDNAMNARLRDNGAGLVPRVLRVSAQEKYAVIGAGAIEATFHAPFGWHVIDDGKRTLVFDAGGAIQINLNLRPTPLGGERELLATVAQSLAEENPQAQFLTFELMDSPCLAARDLRIDGETLDQAYFFRPSHRDGLTLVCRVTADRDNITRAMNTAEVIITTLDTNALPPDPEFAGQPDWWRNAVLLERADKLAEAERTIQDALDHIGVYSSMAHMYELRYARLASEGKEDAAESARQRAIHWLYAYAGSATSGGEGAALSYERDQRIAALGGEASAR